MVIIIINEERERATLTVYETRHAHLWQNNVIINNKTVVGKVAHSLCEENPLSLRQVEHTARTQIECGVCRPKTQSPRVKIQRSWSGRGWLAQKVRGAGSSGTTAHGMNR